MTSKEKGLAADRRPHVVVVDGTARVEPNGFMAICYAHGRLRPEPNWKTATEDDLERARLISDQIMDSLRAERAATYNGRTATIFPLDQPVDVFQDRLDSRPQWGEGGGGIHVFGIDDEDDATDPDETGERFHERLVAAGYEHEVTREDPQDLPPEAISHNETTDLRHWRPLPPEGPGWILVAALESDLGDLIAHWVRPDAALRRPVLQELAEGPQRLH